MSDMLNSGTRFRTLTVLAQGHRGALAVEVTLSMRATRAVQMLDKLVALREAPSAQYCADEPEFVSVALTTGCRRRGL